MARTPDYLDRAQEVISRCQSLARFTEDPPRIRRTFLSLPMRACLQEIESWMDALGMTTHIDAVGNLHGLYPAQDGSPLPRLLIGSHLDTVPDAVLQQAETSGVLVGRLGLTDCKGHPLCASVRPPAIEWSAVSR